ncbi:MAG: PadR family transcriptional regulator [Candidatus Aenigmarchaeota archaeon]|nr:PadR family transcriptional regulator [Candidatus Aenigmarchaeota archaeon]
MRSPSERFEKSMTSDNLWIYILSLLRKRKMYPYELRKEIRKEFGFSPGNVTAYIVLKKLDVGGFVRKEGVSKDRGPERGYYSITESGARELEKVNSLFSKYSEKISNIDNHK